MLPVEMLLRPLAMRQNGAITVGQACGAGASRQQLRTLLTHGWTSPVRGILVEPEPARRRQNLAQLAGWMILRFTWDDVMRRPAWVIRQVAEALALRTPNSRGSGWPTAS